MSADARMPSYDHGHPDYDHPAYDYGPSDYDYNHPPYDHDPPDYDYNHPPYDHDPLTNLDPPTVKVIRSAKRVKTVSARLVEGVLQVRIPAWMSQNEEAELVDSVLARFEEKRRCGHVPLAPRARELAARFGLPEPESIRWSSRQNFRWGSCSTHSGQIRISSRLAQAPPWVLDHVIVHELAHLVVSGHGSEFRKLVNRNPNAERAEGYLLAMIDMAQPAETPRAYAS